MDDTSHKSEKPDAPTHPFLYKCPSCFWTGQFENLDWDITETCMGSEKMEICPQCGSMEIMAVPQNSI